MDDGGGAREGGQTHAQRAAGDEWLRLCPREYGKQRWWMARLEDQEWWTVLIDRLGLRSTALLEATPRLGLAVVHFEIHRAEDVSIARCIADAATQLLSGDNVVVWPADEVVAVLACDHRTEAGLARLDRYLDALWNLDVRVTYTELSTTESLPTFVARAGRRPFRT